MTAELALTIHPDSRFGEIARWCRNLFDGADVFHLGHRGE